MTVLTNGNIGIGTSTPDLAKLQVHGMVGNTVAMFSDIATSTGISLVADYPGIFFNSYWNNGLRSMSASGYSSYINNDQTTGDFTFNVAAVANTTANGLITVPERMRITRSGNIGIGTDAPAASALLDVSSTSQGFLPPRMTIAQRNAIKNPAIGLVIFCTDCEELDMFNGTIWKTMTGTAACVSPILNFIKICDQTWMFNNLNVAKYRNGDDIPQVTNPTTWGNLTTGAWCWYNNDSATYAAIYGRLYNWYAVNDPRGLAPAGWHIPTDAEWTTLANCLQGAQYAGGLMKETGSIHWANPNYAATNSSGFTGLPGGLRSMIVGSVIYGSINIYGYWWSATEWNSTDAWGRFLGNNSSSIHVPILEKKLGISVRCVKD
jgi:uncharacterized protein (TIGR02145 family)